VKAVPDGYTLLFVTSINASNAALYDNLNFNFIRDIVPVASIDRFPFVMKVIPAKTVPEFIAYARVNPGKINMARPPFWERPSRALPGLRRRSPQG
jgi:tripartite-type tricarboxylate transporter receptor subunit TctC